VDRRVLIDVLERVRQSHTTRTALVVDDDYDARTLMHDLLTSLGFTVRVAHSGEAAIRALEEDVPEVLFVDVTMNEKDISKVFDAVSRGKRYERLRTVLVTRSDISREHQEWLQRASAAVVYHGHEHPDELLRELRVALAAIGGNAGTAINS
jgi:twitching motility two-component system response regulator PilH